MKINKENTITQRNLGSINKKILNKVEDDVQMEKFKVDNQNQNVEITFKANVTFDKLKGIS